MRKKRDSVGIADVAALARVSTTTVSYILNNTMPYAGQFTDETRQRVLDAARTLKYTPNVFAAGLRARNRSLIGVFLGESAGAQPPWLNTARAPYASFLLDLLYGINEAALEYDLFPIIRLQPHGRPEDDLDVIDGLHRTGVSDILVYRPHDALLDAIAEADSEGDQQFVVLFGASYANRISCYVDVDNEVIGRVAARELVAQGARRVRIIASQIPGINMSSRLVGALAELADHGIAVDGEVSAFEPPMDLTSIRRIQVDMNECMKHIHADGVLCLTGGLSELAAHFLVLQGRRVPEDVRMVGVDCFHWSEELAPPIPSVHADWRLAGRLGISILRARSENNPLPKLIPPMLYVPQEYAAQLGQPEQPTIRRYATTSLA